MSVKDNEVKFFRKGMHMEKSKMIYLLILAIALALMLGVFIGRISAHNIYYLG